MHIRDFSLKSTQRFEFTRQMKIYGKYYFQNRVSCTYIIERYYDYVKITKFSIFIVDLKYWEKTCIPVSTSIATNKVIKVRFLCKVEAFTEFSNCRYRKIYTVTVIDRNCVSIMETTFLLAMIGYNQCYREIWSKCCSVLGSASVSTHTSVAMTTNPSMEKTLMARDDSQLDASTHSRSSSKKSNHSIHSTHNGNVPHHNKLLHCQWLATCIPLITTYG